MSPYTDPTLPRRILILIAGMYLGIRGLVWILSNIYNTWPT